MDKATGRGGRPLEFLSTHPNPGKRIQDLRGWLPDAEKFYRNSDH
jgi:Zn-dependent protease with chaperone function